MKSRRKSIEMVIVHQFETLKSRFHRIRDWWKNKTPAEKWDSIMQIGIVPGHLIGVHLFCDLIINWYSASCGVMIAMFFTLNFYTIQYYLRQGAFVRGMECTYLLGVVVGVRCFLYHNRIRTISIEILSFIFRICLFIGRQ